MATVNPLKEKASTWIIDRVEKTRGPLTPPLKLEYRRIFTLPTRFGLGFGLLLVVMGGGALNFNNNLALITTFVLVAFTLLSLLLTYRNLADIRVAKISAVPVFAGEQAEFLFWLEERDGRHRPIIQLSLRAPQDCIDLDADGQAALALRVLAHKRGWLMMPDCKIETRYPVGWFRAWSWIRPQFKSLVYPKPMQSPPPMPRGGEGYTVSKARGEGDELQGLRDYQPGDPLNRIAWRTSARHGQLYAKITATPRDLSVHLSWQALKGVDTETRLSIMCAWILIAERKSLPYSLQLPGVDIPVGLGDEHRADCLRALAVFPS
jgi:uncharacterized protein (DUF58 family)